MDWDREEIARLSLEHADMGSPVDIEIVAQEEKLRLYDAPGSDGMLVGNRVYLDPDLPPPRWNFALAHEVGHWLQRKHGLRNTEWGANYIAAALLLPKLDFERALRRYGWDLLLLRAAYPHASFEALARRIVALREARAFIFDRPLRGQRPPSIYSVPYGLRPSDEEKLAAREAVQSGAPVEIRAGLTGWPVVQEDWARAITLAAV